MSQNNKIEKMLETDRLVNTVVYLTSEQKDRLRNAATKYNISISKYCHFALKTNNICSCPSKVKKIIKNKREETTPFNLVCTERDKRKIQEAAKKLSDAKQSYVSTTAFVVSALKRNKAI